MNGRVDNNNSNKYLHCKSNDIVPKTLSVCVFCAFCWLKPLMVVDDSVIVAVVVVIIGI